MVQWTVNTKAVLRHRFRGNDTATLVLDTTMHHQLVTGTGELELPFYVIHMYRSRVTAFYGPMQCEGVLFVRKQEPNQQTTGSSRQIMVGCLEENGKISLHFHPLFNDVAGLLGPEPNP